MTIHSNIVRLIPCLPIYMLSDIDVGWRDIGIASLPHLQKGVKLCISELEQAKSRFRISPGSRVLSSAAFLEKIILVAGVLGESRRFVICTRPRAVPK
jgi:hypothetical protein